MARKHIQHWALAALVARSGQTKSAIARRADVTPQVLSDLIAGRLAGHSTDLRQRVAAAIDVDVRAITCWCNDRRQHVGE